MKKLCVYTTVVTAILLILSVTFLQSQLRDAKKARSEEPEVVEVPENDYVEISTSIDIDLPNESVYDIVPDDENPLYNDEIGEVHDSPGLRKTPRDMNLPKDVYNTDYDTDSINFYKLDYDVDGNDNISPASCKEICDNTPSIKFLIQECNLKPWYSKAVYNGDVAESYYLFFKNCDAAAYIIRDIEAESFTVGGMLPTSKIDEGRNKSDWEKPLIIYKYLSKYDKKTMDNLESKLSYDDFEDDIWWTNYMLGDKTATFWRVTDVEHKYPIKVKVEGQ